MKYVDVISNNEWTVYMNALRLGKKNIIVSDITAVVDTGSSATLIHSSYLKKIVKGLEKIQGKCKLGYDEEYG